ncbi:hypothetical protein MCC93_00680 [Morococcus cerebrosus]|uniref:Uncharacterized protein n=1 Tax=Morococcus cerebrosus TaxID=1056807 RepID=A0A0C1HG49_9NEIS|nr:hypothetical protein MCC93_00680 [Morococcus cerebrosus]
MQLTGRRHSRAGGNPFLNFGKCFSSTCFFKFPMDSRLCGNDGWWRVLYQKLSP